MDYKGDNDPEEKETENVHGPHWVCPIEIFL